MKIFLIAAITLFHGIFSGGAAAGQTAKLEVVIDGFRNGQGLANVVLFNDKKGFPVELDKGYRQLTKKIVKGRAILVFEAIPQGRYAVSVIHDEDSDGKMNTNFIGIPKEGFSVSNNAMGSFGPPPFEDAAIEIRSERVSISMKIKY